MSTRFWGVKVLAGMALACMLVVGAGQVQAEDDGGAAVLRYQVLVADKIAFGVNQSGLTRTQRSIIDVMAQWLKENPETMVTVEGHADASERKVDKLSQSRAELVHKILVRKGVNPERLKIASFGSAKPLVEGRDNRSKARNRRVEFNVIREVSFEDQVHFKPGAASLADASQLDGIASRLASNPNVSLRVVGHAELGEEDDPERLRALSVSRASSVRQELMRRGVAGNRLQVAGVGHRGPKPTNHNRRVNFYIVAY